MFEILRNAIFGNRHRRSRAACTPAAADGGEAGEQLPLRPTIAQRTLELPLPVEPPRPVRPRLAVPPIIAECASIPPIVGERAYYDDKSHGCMAWEINGNKSFCHFSAPNSFYPGPHLRFIGVVEKVDGVCHHVPRPTHFSVEHTR